MHEDTMQTKRTRVRDTHRVEKLFVLLLLSNAFSFASQSRQIETKLIGETAHLLDSDALGGTQSDADSATVGPIKPNRA